MDILGRTNKECFVFHCPLLRATYMLFHLNVSIIPPLREKKKNNLVEIKNSKMVSIKVYLLSFKHSESLYSNGTLEKNYSTKKEIIYAIGSHFIFRSELKKKQYFLLHCFRMITGDN